MNTQLEIGYGAYFSVADVELSAESLIDRVQVKRFEQTNSTKLELQTMLWALKDVIDSAPPRDMTIMAYTDSQNIVTLPARQAKLEQNAYISGKGNKLRNYALYQEFYQLTAKLNCQFIKVKGHQPSELKSTIDKLFTLVDQQSRKALREASH